MFIFFKILDSFKSHLILTTWICVVDIFFFIVQQINSILQPFSWEYMFYQLAYMFKLTICIQILLWIVRTVLLSSNICDDLRTLEFVTGQNQYRHMDHSCKAIWARASSTHQSQGEKAHVVQRASQIYTFFGQNSPSEILTNIMWTDDSVVRISPLPMKDPPIDEYELWLPKLMPRNPLYIRYTTSCTKFLARHLCSSNLSFKMRWSNTPHQY